MKRLQTILLLLGLVLTACGGDGAAGSEQPAPGDGDGDGDSTGHKPGVTPETGATEFISADSHAGQSGSRGAVDGGLGAAPPNAEAGDDAGGDDRQVERGDIFRVLGDGRILNLNAYRGLQVIDVRDVSKPKIEGRLSLTGTPVELYVVGDRAIVLLNDWRGYYGTRQDVQVEVEEGGLVAVIDISDRSAPSLIDDAHVPGYISTSRLTQGGGSAALYVAAQDYGYSSRGGIAIGPATSQTILRSFDVTGRAIVAKSSIDLGGYVQDIQATGADVLMVARHDWERANGRSTVALVDISSPTGEMVLGDEITPRGRVQNKFNMDVSGDVLRIVSGSDWGGTNENHLETFDIRDLRNAVPLDHCSFGAGEQLYATLFVDHRAFFVTYFRVDPFHAFSIDEQGQCEEHAEFIVSGWNDFFRATLGDSRLIGIGRNDENNRNVLAVSLYDISDIGNPTPLIEREEIDLQWGHSEAQWDDRAFSVLDGAVSVLAADGQTEETGLVLMPFEGWNESTQQYLAQVQIFTFSSTTLTRRGVMDHGSSVRRSFLSDDATAANLSEEQLSLYDVSSPNAPEELGRLDVAPSFSKVLGYGDYVARVRDRGRYYYGSVARTPKARVELVPRAAVLDEAPAVASFEVPSGAELLQVGDLLVSVRMEYVRSDSRSLGVYRTDVAVFDLSDPTAPRARGTLTTEALQPSNGYGYYGGIGLADIDCLGFGCGRGYYGYGGGNGTLVAGNALVFPMWTSQEKTLGRVERCSTYPTGGYCYAQEGSDQSSCPDTYDTGGIECQRALPNGQEWCTGDIYTCRYDGGGCRRVDPSAVSAQRHCYQHDDVRYWSSMRFAVLSLANPDAPALSDVIATPADEEAQAVLAHGSDVYLSYQKPISVARDPRPFVRRYFRKLDVSRPSAPALGQGINVPGEVIAVDGDHVFTRDVVWDDLDSETLVARLRIDGNVARLEAQRLFDGRQVSAVEPDGGAHVLVSHGPSWSYLRGYDDEPYTLSILASDDLGVQGTASVDRWASFIDAQDGKAIFSVSGGLLVFDVQNPKKPVAQAYFPTDSWYTPDLLLKDGEILFAAGPYGIYRFDANAYNLRSR